MFPFLPPWASTTSWKLTSHTSAETSARPNHVADIKRKLTMFFNTWALVPAQSICRILIVLKTLWFTATVGESKTDRSKVDDN